MKTIYKYLRMVMTIAILILFFHANSQISMTISGAASQNFDALGPAGGTWIDNNTIPNWYWQQDLIGSVGYSADDGTSEPVFTTRYAYFGIGTSTPEIAIGGISTAGTGLAMGVQLKNNSGAEINEISLSYTGEQWHVDGDIIASSKLTFWYKISSSIITDLTPSSNNGWTSVSALDFTSPTTSSFSINGKLDGNDPANRKIFSNVIIPNLVIPSGSYIMFRWLYTDQGVKHGLAIDDVSINWVGNSVCSTGNWNLRRNWNNGIPDAFTNAVINGTVIENTNNSCYNLIINPGKSLTINAGKTITVNKNVLIKTDGTDGNNLGVGNLLNNGTLSITGSATVQMFVQGTTIHNGIYFSPPLNNISAPSVSDLVYRYNASTCTWVLVYGTLNVGTGYTVRSDNPVIINLNGGTLTNNSVYIGGLVRQATPNNYGWNLVGNPFVCGLDWEILNDVSTNYTNLTNGFYIRCSDGSLASYVNGVGTPAGTTSIIPPMQGFYAQVIIGQTTGNLNMPLNARTINFHPFYDNEIPLIRLKISDGTYSDETVIRINDNATENFDNNFDGDKMFGDNVQIFTLTPNDEKLCINSISLNKEIEIPIGLIINNDGNYTVNAFDFNNIDENISFYLKDNITNTIQDLRKNSTYNFNISKTYDTKRFSIILSKKYDGINEENVSNINVYSVNKNIYIQSEGSMVKIYDVLGREIFNKKIDSGLQKIELIVDGVYIVKLDNIVKKVIIQ